jgi:uncharacterized glyoxalase superfamily protein PhnB
MLKTAIPVIHVGDSRRAEAFYCQRLGFQLLASWRPDPARGDPCYMTVARDAARLHLTSFKDGVVGTWTSTVYVYVDDVDALYAELEAKGISMRAPIDQDWGTREFGVRDADRNLITFGQQRTPQVPKTSG